MLKIFEEETRTQKLMDVEAALAMAHAEVGNIPKKDAEKILEMASTKYVKVERIKAIEKEIKHDIMSMVRALSEQCGESRRIRALRRNKLRHRRHRQRAPTQRRHRPYSRNA